MNAKLSQASRLDQLDREAFRDMIASAPFQTLWKRVRAEHERAREACVAGDSVPAIRRAQGAAAALRSVLGMPEQLLGEMGVRKI